MMSKPNWLRLLALLGCATLAAAQDVQPLAPNTRLERELSGSQAHHYRIALKAGQFVHFDVLQKSIDVVMTLTAPDGKQVAEVNVSTFGLPDALSEIATVSGDYQLTIRSISAPNIKGNYQLKAEIKDAATDTDKKRLAAERLMWEYGKLSEPQKRLENAQQARALWAELGERFWEGFALSRISLSYNLLNDQERALASMEQVLEIMREVKNRAGEAIALRNLGGYQYQKGMQKEMIESYEKALVIARELNHKQLEVVLLYGLVELGRGYGQAVERWEQVLRLAREVGDKRVESNTLIRLGSVYMVLGNYERAIEYFEKKLQLSIEAKSKLDQIGAYNHLGTTFRLMGRNEQAMEALQKALQLSREEKRSDVEAGVLRTISKLEFDLANYEKALEAAEKALLLDSVNGFGKMDAHRDLGNAYRGLKQFDKAIGYHDQALQETRSIQNTHYERLLYVELMRDWKGASFPDTAIFYGKQAINSYQRIRSDIRQLDGHLQQNFIKAKEEDYRTLADLLISQARLPEAEQVLRMLKEEEFFDYIRGDNNAPKGEKATLTPKEEAADKRYREIADKLAALGAERAALLNKPSRTAEENQRLAQIESDLVVAGQTFQKFLDQLSTELGTRKAGDAAVGQLNESQAFMDDLREMGTGAVALYTIVSEDRFHVILTTSEVRKSYSYPIKAADLNRKVLAFRQALQNPRLDPLPFAQELYQILVAPLAKDLQAAKAETLMWSLDGVLRYVPIAALHDGNKYLVERWRNVVFTAASKARLKDDPSRNWKALGLGVTKAHGENIPALPAVADEMRGIIKTDENAAGVLPGTIKLDEQFTQEAMQAALRQQPSVVHVASHFLFQPGNETNSALLLGDGNFLSLAQIKTLPNVFRGVELLTLSACNTALGSSSEANGKEIEGFGMLAQQQGAKAVVASLWPVADRSTKELMQEFYRFREANRTLKSEALRQAQAKLLRGEMVSTIDLTQREIVHEADKTANLPRFKADPKKPYAHPYYWAPFILIGNWK